MQHNVVLKVAYDGTSYFGWQKTRHGPSIEQALQEVLQQIFQHPITLQAASRTDRGVHADGQVVNFSTTKPIKDLLRLRISLNQLLPPDIRIMEVQLAPPSFHPTLDATAKEYHYRIVNSDVLPPCLRLYAWHVSKKLGLEEMRAAAALLEGTHDFASFRNRRKQQKEGTTRALSKITISKQAHLIIIKMTGSNFLYKMARNIAGALVYIGLGKLEPSQIPHILHKKSRPLAGITAPAQGLCLHKVLYSHD